MKFSASKSWCVVLFERADLFYVIFGKYVDYGGGFLFTGKDFMGN